MEYNPCLLAKPIQTKTCRQVYEYIKQDPKAASKLANKKASKNDNGTETNGGTNNNEEENENNHRHHHHEKGTTKSRKQRARQTHFLAHKLHDAAAAAAAEEETDEEGELETLPFGKSKKRKHSRSHPRAGHTGLNNNFHIDYKACL